MCVKFTLGVLTLQLGSADSRSARAQLSRAIRLGPLAPSIPTKALGRACNYAGNRDE